MPELGTKQIDQVLMKFKRIYLEISNLCNVQCSFCPVVDRDKTIMAPDLFKKHLTEIAPYTEEVCLHLMGEPGAHPKIKEILSMATELGVKINLTTNGLNIEKKANLYQNSSCLRQINFSLQAYKDNFPHKALSGYLLPILKFTQELLEQREDIYVNYRLWNVGAEAQHNEEIFTEIEKFFQIQINRNIQVENIKSKRIWKKLYLHFDSRFVWPSLDAPELGTQGRCHGLKSHIGIHADGTVVPCCLDKEAVIKLGNLNEQSLGDILASELAVNIKQGFEQNQLQHDLCKRCEYIRRFAKT